jgi:4-hydroxy-3-methylbut-2-enyl diphosphate reductase IspH
VTKVHREAVRFARDDFEILLIGHDGHEEVEERQERPPTTSPSSTRPRKPIGSS